MQHSRGVLTALFILCLLTSAAILGQDLFVSDLSAGMAWHIIIQLQLPLVFTAILVGAGLSVSAATLQVTLHNPLADPGIIGISSGASLMAALVLLTLQLDSVNYFYLLPLACFVGALLSTGLIYMVARRLRASATAVILAGIAISTIAGAIMAWLYILADAQALRNLTFWLMGSLYQTDWWILAVAGPLISAGLFYQLSQAGALNWLYGGSALAAAAGAPEAPPARHGAVRALSPAGTRPFAQAAIARRRAAWDADPARAAQPARGRRRRPAAVPTAPQQLGARVPQTSEAEAHEARQEVRRAVALALGAVRLPGEG